MKNYFGRRSRLLFLISSLNYTHILLTILYLKVAIFTGTTFRVSRKWKYSFRGVLFSQIYISYETWLHICFCSSIKLAEKINCYELT